MGSLRQKLATAAHGEAGETQKKRKTRPRNMHAPMPQVSPAPGRFACAKKFLAQIRSSDSCWVPWVAVAVMAMAVTAVFLL